MGKQPRLTKTTLLGSQAPPACAVDLRSALDDATPLLHRVSPASQLLRVAPPLCLASVLSSSWGLHLDFSLRIEATGSHVPHESLNRAHATFMPDAAQPVSRHLLDSIPRQRLLLGFDAIHTLSTLHQWFTCVRLRDPHLTRSSRAFSLNASHHGSLPQQLGGGLKPAPASRLRGAVPHLSCSKAASRQLSRAAPGPPWLYPAFAFVPV